MAMTLHVVYPATEGTKFDYDYYSGTHLPMVREHMGATIDSTLVAKGLAGGAPDQPAPYHAIATLVFADQAAMDAAMAHAGPVVADIPNFTDTQPVMMVGSTL